MSSYLKNYIPEAWQALLVKELEADYFNALETFLIQERNEQNIYPSDKQVFNAFAHTMPSDIKVVIIGQDPYHGQGQAHGLAFSVPQGVAKPPSLVNIFKELKSDLDVPFPADGNLLPWAKQGVFLLNSTLTVRAGQAGSHQKKGWEQFTDAVIHAVSSECEHIVFLLWGNYAKAKASLIDPDKHLILTAAHPSPLSAYNGFWGCKHFSKANDYLQIHGQAPIDWSLHSFFN